MAEERWGPALASAGAAAAATLLTAFAVIPVMDLFESFWAGFGTALAVAGLLHTAVGVAAPRTGAAMLAPPAALFAWTAWAFAGAIDGPRTGALLLVAVPSLGIGTALSGFVALGAALRGLRRRPAPYP